MAYTMTWTDCEHTMENIMANIKTIDPYHKLSFMTMIIQSYYKLYDNKISPYDIEQELRKHDLNVGLIAVDWTTDPHYKKIVDENKGKIIKRQYFSLYKSNHNIDLDHLSKYVTFISCRPRQSVIEETLTHSSSMEENLCKLKEAGDLMIITDLDDILDTKTDIKIDQNDLNAQIQAGTKLLKITKFTLEEIFMKTAAANPTAKVVPICANISGLIDNGKIICQVGICLPSNKYVLLNM